MTTKTKLDGWNELVRAVKAPPDVMSAMFTGRPELLAGRARTLSAEECAQVFDVLGVLIETNHELQRHAREVATRMSQVERALGGLLGTVERARQFANFETEIDHDDD